QSFLVGKTGTLTNGAPAEPLPPQLPPPPPQPLPAFKIWMGVEELLHVPHISVQVAPPKMPQGPPPCGATRPAAASTCCAVRKEPEFSRRMVSGITRDDRAGRAPSSEMSGSNCQSGWEL